MATTSSQTNILDSSSGSSSSSLESPVPPYHVNDQNAQNLPSQSQPVYKMYKRRWIGMLVIVFLNIATGLVWLTFSTVSEISEKWLNASSTEMNLASILYFVGSIIASMFSGFVFEKWGIKYALVFGGILNLIGCWIRYFASFIDSTEDSHEARLVVILIGQLIAASAQPFFLNAPPKYSAVWFSDSSRVLATTIGTVSNPLGIAVAMLVIPGICTEENGDDMPLTLLVIGIVAIVALAPTFFIPATPPTPPSASAEIALAEAKDESFLVALKKVATNLHFWILFLAFAISVAVFNSVTSLLDQITSPYGYSEDDAGIFGACFIGAGFVGAGISGVFVDKTKKYMEVLRVMAPLIAVGYVALFFTVREDFFPWIAINCAFLGMVAFAVLPVVLELGVECTYPHPPSTSTSVLWMGGQLFAVCFVLVGDQLKGSSPFKDEPSETMSTALLCAAVVSILVSFLAFLFSTPYHRMEAEAERMRSNNVENGEGTQ